MYDNTNNATGEISSAGLHQSADSHKSNQQLSIATSV